MASHTIVQQAVSSARELQQLREQNAKLIGTVTQQDQEIARNRDTIAAQGRRILDIERELNELRTKLAAANHAAESNQVAFDGYFGLVNSALNPQAPADGAHTYDGVIDDDRR